MNESPSCPLCGNAEWEEAQQQFVLREADPRIIHGGGTDVSAFFCTRCGFVRLHRAAVTPEGH
jgi:predicted nucleic-acid-binding Zn-ribbon protein